MAVRLRKRRSFPGVPVETAIAIRDVEENVATAVVELDAGARSSWLQVIVATDEVSAKPWDLIVSDRNVAILLPKPTLSLVGKEIGAVQVAGTITVKAIDSLVDGAASTSGPGAMLSRIWICTLKGWHSVA